MQDIVADHPSIADMFSIGTSVEGRTIWALRITGPGTGKHAVLLQGAQHGNEQPAASMVAFVADHLVNSYGSDADVAALVDGLVWYFVPIVNPDGYVNGILFWNANSVDLNENWGGPAGDLGTHGGPYPFSEPETAAMRDFLTAHPEVRLQLDLHVESPRFLWPWGYTYHLSKDEQTFRLLAERIRESLRAGTNQDYRMGPAWHAKSLMPGNSFDYAYGDLGIWSFFLGMSYTYDYAAYLPAFLDLNDWVLDCNANGTADSIDLATGSSQDCNSNKTPDECDGSDCNGNGLVDECELLDGAASDANGNYRLDACEADCAITPQWNKLFAEDGGATDQFGRAVDTDGETILVGAQGDDDLELDNGSAYIFGRTTDGWVQKQKLIASDATTVRQYRFGRSVAVSGDVAVVGAGGAVYVYRRSGELWQQEDKLIETGGIGGAVDLSGNVLVVGAPSAKLTIDSSEGKAFVFRYDGVAWQPEAALSPGTEADIHGFGESVALSENIIHVSAKHDLRPDLGCEAPVSYLFAYDGTSWSLAGRHDLYKDPECNVHDVDVAVSESVAAFGSPWTWHYEMHYGTAFVLGPNGALWEPNSQLLNYEPGHSTFGKSVTAEADTVVVSDQSGSALYVYRPLNTTWVESLKLTLPPATTARGGGEIALANGVLVVGVDQEPGAGLETGAVYVLDEFDALQSDCNANGLVDACDSSTFGDFDADGMPGLSDLAALVQCFAGPLIPPDPAVAECSYRCLAVFDANDDRDVDLADVASFQRLAE